MNQLRHQTERVGRSITGLMLRAILGAALVTTMSACADSLAAPTARQAVRPTAANHDGLPPDTPCLSGWIEVDGRWVCGDTSGGM